MTTYVLVLTSLATPWAVITMIGFWQTRGRFDEPSLQVFNRRERGGAYWFTHGWNIDAVVAWAVGSAVGVMSNSTTSFEGPVAHWLGGLDASVVTSAVTGGLLYVVLVAVRPHAHAPAVPRSSSPRRQASQMEVLMTRYGGQYGPDITFLGVDPCDLEDTATFDDADVVIVGAPFDGGTSYRSGARFGPQAIRMTDYLPHDGSRPSLALRVDGLADLKVVDGGDVEMYSGDAARSCADLEAVIERVTSTGAIPLVLGGDHTITWPNATGLARALGWGRISIIHFDAHADTGDITFGSLIGHGHPMRQLIESGAVRGDRFLQVGLRGYWPEPETLDWMAGQGMRSYEMTEIVHRGLDDCLTEAFEIATDDCDGVFLSVDIDVCDPGHAPGTGPPSRAGCPRASCWTPSAGSPSSCPSWAWTSSRWPRPTTTPTSPPRSPTGSCSRPSPGSPGGGTTRRTAPPGTRASRCWPTASRPRRDLTASRDPTSSRRDLRPGQGRAGRGRDADLRLRPGPGAGPHRPRRGRDRAARGRPTPGWGAGLDRARRQAGRSPPARGQGRGVATAPFTTSPSIRSAAPAAPGRARISAPRRAAAARWGPSPSSEATTGRSWSAVAFFRTTRPAPAASTDRATRGWSSIGCIGISTIGRSWARACIVVPCPPWPIISEARGMSSDVRHEAMDLGVGGRHHLAGVDHRARGGDHMDVEVGAGIEDRLQALGHP